jgi:predicted ATP-binding protein involved in virulence
MRITKLKLKNIGIFENIELNFKDRITVLLGSNSVGKTTILKSIIFQSTVSIDQHGNFSSLLLDRDGTYYSNTQWLKDFFIRTFKNKFGMIKLELENNKNNYFRQFFYQSDLFKGGEYPEGQGPLQTNLGSNFPIPIIFSDAYRRLETESLNYPDNKDYLEGEVTNLISILSFGESKNLQKWLVSRYLLKDSNDQRMQNEFDYFINKLSEILPGHLSLKFKDINNGYEPIFTQNGIDVPLKYLSSGVQSILFMFYQIIIRLSNFYKNDKSIENVFLQEGLVLIDEIDAHLHPEWQRVVIKSVTELFPNVQFIISSHSPLVASSCSNAQVIRLFREKNKIKAEHPKGTKGWLAEDILREIMGVESSRDIEIQKAINRAEKLYIKKIQKKITEKESKELNNKLLKLSKLLPPSDPTLSIIKYDALSKAIKEMEDA